MKVSRVRQLKDGAQGSGPVIYWMQRDQRVQDNWALLYAQQLALERKVPCIVLFNQVSDFLGASPGHYAFMMSGLQEVKNSLAAYAIPFILIKGNPHETIPDFIRLSHGSVLITDFLPLTNVMAWKKSISEHISIPFYEVDAHNVIPCWIASPKQEFAARTFRPKVHRQLGEYLEEFPALIKHPFVSTQLKSLAVSNRSGVLIEKVPGFLPGEQAALGVLKGFIASKLGEYDLARNLPEKKGQSGLSPYLHFGQISAARIALEVQKSSVSFVEQEVFLEELIVRKELSDNFCFYNEKYDKVEGFPAWAQKTLNEHRYDVRPVLYTASQLEQAETYDELWNAAQMEMVKTGKMHGYLRMYWAKKILEWTSSPEEALKIAIHNNDSYSLDGRDPNGYVGIAWSIGGVHDRAWFERSIFGKIRYMSYNGCKSKFSISQYCAYVASL